MIRPRLPRMRRRKRPGAAPGTLVHVGERHVERPRIDVFDYDAERVSEDRVDGVDALPDVRGGDTTTWVNVTGLHDEGVIAAIGERFGVHPLVLEDLLNTDQRAKVERYDGYAFIVLKMVTADPGAKEADVEQVSLLVFPGAVVSFQEKPGDVFEPVRERIRRGGPRIRRGGADYLAYTLVDAVVDQFGVLTDGLMERLDGLEDEVIERRGDGVVSDVHGMRHELLALRKLVVPTRDLVTTLTRDEVPPFTDETRLYLRDVQDHATRALEVLEAGREGAKNLLDLYLSLSSHRMNEVMKVLTIIATIFIPLTFIAGVYGMNFEHMPELSYRWAYPATWLVMISVAFGLLFAFRRRGWL